MSDLLLMSGGIDSAAIAAWMKPTLCLTIDYGQRPAQAEVQASSEICKALGLPHRVLAARIPELGSGDLINSLPSPHSSHSEFWPFRNQYLITLGAMYAMKFGCSRVLIGTVATDQRHLDGSPKFITTIDSLLAMQEGSIGLTAPAATLTSFELVKKSGILEEVLGWCHSCHTANLACGRCPGCLKHSQVMAQLGWLR